MYLQGFSNNNKVFDIFNKSTILWVNEAKTYNFASFPSIPAGKNGKT